MNDTVNIISLTEASLKTIMYDVVMTALSNHNLRDLQRPSPKIKGIHGLAEALGCSPAKAQQIKNSGTIRYFQDGKLVLFDYDQVLEDLKGQNINKRGRKPGHAK